MSDAAPRHLAVVQRGRKDVYERLTAMATRNVTVIWDRRRAERRTVARPPLLERRRRDRRRRVPGETWETLGFIVVRCDDARP